MLRYISITAMFIFFTFVTDLVYSQQPENNNISGIVAGTNANYQIVFKNGKIVKGKVLNITKTSIQVKENSGSIQTYNLIEINRIDLMPAGSIGSFGIGLGVPYGILGVNLELKIIQYLYITGGIGTAILVSGPAYNIGAKYYFTEPDKNWRPRVSAYYGINSMIFIDDSNNEIREKYLGYSFGFGQKWSFGFDKKHGLDLDLMYLVFDDDFISTKEQLENQGYKFGFGTGQVKISFGYRINF